MFSWCFHNSKNSPYIRSERKFLKIENILQLPKSFSPSGLEFSFFYLVLSNFMFVFFMKMMIPYTRIRGNQLLEIVRKKRKKLNWVVLMKRKNYLEMNMFAARPTILNRREKAVTRQERVFIIFLKKILF